MAKPTKKKSDAPLPSTLQQQSDPDEVEALRAEIARLKAILKYHTGKSDY